MASHGCGLILGFNELITSESRTDVIEFLKNLFTITERAYEYCLYDNGCHLSESIQANLAHNNILKDLKCYIDKFHLKNHVRTCCKTIYNPYNQTEIADIDTQICEQKFGTINKHKHAVKHMTKYHFIFFWLCIFENLNTKIVGTISKEREKKVQGKSLF